MFINSKFKANKNLHAGGGGFTLIELLIVIVILGLLMAIGIGSFQSSQIKGRDARRKNDLAQVQRALELYFNDYNQYPDSSDLPLSGGPWEDDNETLYLKEFPQDPRFGNYNYVLGGSGASYQLYARLENVRDPAIGTYAGISCGDEDCNYGVASSNANPED